MSNRKRTKGEGQKPRPRIRIRTEAEMRDTKSNAVAVVGAALLDDDQLVAQLMPDDMELVGNTALTCARVAAHAIREAAEGDPEMVTYYLGLYRTLAEEGTEL
jgi:hypothetical protein